MAVCRPLAWDSIIKENAVTWVVYSILILLSLFGALGNAMVLYIYRRDRIRHPYHLFTVALAVDDFVMCVVGTPALPMIFVSSSDYLIAAYTAVVGYIFCQNMNLYFLVAVYKLAVVKGVDTNARSMSIAKGLCVGSFLASLSMVPLFALGRLGYLNLHFCICVWTMTQYFVVLVCMSSFYLFIYCRLGSRCQSRVSPNQVTTVSFQVDARIPPPSPFNVSIMFHAETQEAGVTQTSVTAGSRVVTVDHAGSEDDGTRTVQLQGRKQMKIARAGLTLLMCTVVFMLCWAPSVFGDNLGLFNATRIRTVIFFQCAANPVIYFYSQAKFKHEVKLKLRKCFRCFSR